MAVRSNVISQLSPIGAVVVGGDYQGLTNSPIGPSSRSTAQSAVGRASTKPGPSARVTISSRYREARTLVPADSILVQEMIPGGTGAVPTISTGSRRHGARGLRTPQWPVFTLLSMIRAQSAKNKIRDWRRWRVSMVGLWQECCSTWRKVRKGSAASQTPHSGLRGST